jgi:D-glycero-D-manno-heptose 1,7-bisphosphate phosphatase
MAGNRAVFLDRDGVINEDKAFVHLIRDFRFLPGVFPALKKLQGRYLLVITTNQSGIARGYYSEQDFLRLNDWMLGKLAGKGIRIAAVKYCPHDRDAGCSCRKPKTGLIRQAQRELRIDLAKSWVIGDKDADVLFGRNAGCRTIRVRSKYRNLRKPDCYAEDLAEAAGIIMGGEYD